MRDNLDLRCGSNFYLVGILLGNGGEEYSISPRKQAFPRIRDTPFFCPYMVLSGGAIGTGGYVI